jgi:hypothetical protein
MSDFPIDPIFRVKTERGKSREEYYLPGKKEQFGLAKRTRRNQLGIPVTLPNGEWPKEYAKAAGA